MHGAPASCWGQPRRKVRGPTFTSSALGSIYVKGRKTINMEYILCVRHRGSVLSYQWRNGRSKVWAHVHSHAGRRWGDQGGNQEWSVSKVHHLFMSLNTLSSEDGDSLVQFCTWAVWTLSGADLEHLRVNTGGEMVRFFHVKEISLKYFCVWLWRCWCEPGIGEIWGRQCI